MSDQLIPEHEYTRGQLEEILKGYREYFKNRPQSNYNTDEYLAILYRYKKFFTAWEHLVKNNLDVAIIQWPQKPVIVNHNVQNSR